MKFKNIIIIYNVRTYSQQDYEDFVHKHYSAYKGIEKTIILMERTPDLLFSICMCIENNITYIPIDPTYPKERINYIIENSNATSIINDTNIDIAPLARIGHNASNDDNLAYILYTSGSTGNPKGVEITKEGLHNFIEGVSEIIDFSIGKRIACFTTVSFDIFFLESIMPLYKGLTVVLANDNEQRNPKLMADFIVNNKVDMVQMTPSRMQLLLNYDSDLSCLRDVKEIMIGGDQFPLNLLKKLQQVTAAKIYNMYGPTETTIWSTVSELTGKDQIDIGKPIKNTQIFITDELLNPLASGQVGEICIAGAGLAKGYYGKNELTAEKFVFLPSKPEMKVYRTGDLGKCLQNGDYECLGRIDNQVKIRGYRIELEEIERNINQYPAILQSVVRVIDLGESDKRLDAFYISDQFVDENKLKQFLLQKLPEYMVPVKYIPIKEFVYLPNGKIDRRGFNNLDALCSAITNDNINDALLSNGQQIIFDTIKANFDEEQFSNISLDTEMLSVGIDSITFITIIVSLEEKFGFEFDNEMLLITAFPTIKSMVDYVELKINSIGMVE